MQKSRKQWANLPTLPPAVITKTLKTDDAQALVLRQLGVALVLQWDAIPDALQDLLIDQAASEAGVEAARVDIENYIRKARPVALPVAVSAKTDAATVNA